MKNTLVRTFALMLAAMLLLCFVGCKGDPTTDVGASSIIGESSDIATSDKTESEDEPEEDEKDETSSKPSSRPSSSSSSRPASSSSSRPSSSSSSRPSSSSSSRPSYDETSSRPSSRPSSTVETSSDTETNNYPDDEPEEDEKYEKPNCGNDTVLFNKQTSKYDSEANALRQKIINSKDSGLKGSKTYYVSYKGNDYNSGTSPDSPWKTINKVNSAFMPANSVVLFERGGVYRGSLQLKSNTSYGAYGSGPKPCIYGSKKNYADESLWTKSTTKAGYWETKVDERDVGQIVFDHGVKVATKASNRNTATEYVYIISGGTLYLRVPDNPAKLHDSIEISGFDHILHTSTNGASNIIVENICIKYGGKHGMSFPFCENITVRNCEVGYIGGVGGSVPLGNGIEFWLDTNNVTVENCWVYQCFDAGITNQGQRKDGKPNVQQNITYKDNLIEYCIYGIEYFAGQGSNGSTIKNTVYTGNIIRFSGLGWSKPGYARVGETDQSTAVAAINGWATNTGVGTFPAENFVIENNIFDTSWKYLVSFVEPNVSGRVTVRNNTYYQQSSKMASIWFANKQIVKVESLSQMKAEIANIDSNPKSVGLD